MFLYLSCVTFRATIMYYLVFWNFGLMGLPLSGFISFQPLLCSLICFRCHTGNSQRVLPAAVAAFLPLVPPGLPPRWPSHHPSPGCILKDAGSLEVPVAPHSRNTFLPPVSAPQPSDNSCSSLRCHFRWYSFSHKTFPNLLSLGAAPSDVLPQRRHHGTDCPPWSLAVHPSSFFPLRRQGLYLSHLIGTASSPHSDT